MRCAQANPWKVLAVKIPAASAERSRSFLTSSGARMKNTAFTAALTAIKRLTKNKNAFSALISVGADFLLRKLIKNLNF